MCMLLRYVYYVYSHKPLSLVICIISRREFLKVLGACKNTLRVQRIHIATYWYVCSMCSGLPQCASETATKETGVPQENKAYIYMYLIIPLFIQSFKYFC